ncbi:dynamin family protein [Rhodovulum iodosum]|uniref:dynamin family protein n=1 Tax=Rhodovulum iodosum TaxID=68291 RepID=UPI0014737068|nr:dynamin family protein [Rhodovulum robiginosum]
MSALSRSGDDSTRKGAERLERQIDHIEPSVTMIGQVKAGKTSLVNAMVGWPGLLPADVNPWTSVVTSLHINPPQMEEPINARFRFFDRYDWDRLIRNGGRIGELASRAGADEEMAKVRDQIERMREKSSSRLGRRFELLMGQEHAFQSFDEELIARYVCLGDDFGEADPGADMQGRFADITKTADLYLHRPEIPLPLCIRDTPGVNDTFLMREQITIHAIRDSRLCVLVLSAHQALSTVDMALIRLISNIKSRDLIIFVNRIDELSDPVSQVPEIRDSIQRTLQKHNGPADAQIIFGSAYWGLHALTGRVEQMAEASSETLLKWVEENLEEQDVEEDPHGAVWSMSGVPALYRALAERITEGAGQEAVNRLAAKVGNLARGVRASAHSGGAPNTDRRPLQMERPALIAEFEAIRSARRRAMDEAFAAQLDLYNVRLDRSHRSFLDRATTALIEHLQKNGERAVWTYDPTGLRMLLRSAYKAFGSKVMGATKKVLADTAADIDALYVKALDLDAALGIEPPTPARVPPPVVIGQTIALDIRGTWWRNWWQRRRGYSAFAESFQEMIRAETDPIVSDLKGAQAQLIREEAVETLDEFIAEHRELMLARTGQQAKTDRAAPLLLSNPILTDTLASVSATVERVSRGVTAGQTKEDAA